MLREYVSLNYKKENNLPSCPVLPFKKNTAKEDIPLPPHPQISVWQN
jgi:hypothetical protein